MPGDNITILHLSDLQFGKNHRFAGVELTVLPNPYDTLLARLWEDLQRLRQNHGLQPELLIVSGELAEWGLPDEFRDAREFLDLPRPCVAMIPGNHAINRKACSAYFDNCEADGLKPVARWWRS